MTRPPRTPRWLAAVSLAALAAAIILLATELRGHL